MIMRIKDDREREAATQTLKEVMRKLEEALKLSREAEEHKTVRECTGAPSAGSELRHK